MMKGMRRLSLILALLLVAASASALTQPRRPTIALLDLAPQFEMQVEAFGAMRDALKVALGKHGFDVYKTADHYDDLVESKSGNADYYLEIVGNEHEEHPLADGQVGVGPVAVGVTAVKNRHFLELRVYDGRTLEMLRSYQFNGSNTTVMQRFVGLYGYEFMVSVFTAPWTNRRVAQQAVDLVANDAATHITRDLTEYQHRK
jgi:hypothetical protein